MREQLIRYLLGELDDDELVDLRARLEKSPELQRELAHLRSCFAANQETDAEPFPPRSLAERTADRVANSDEYELEAIASGSKSMSNSSDPPAGVLGWSLADLTVAGGVMLAVSMLVFPAIRDSRDGTRLNVCQNNQIQLWLAVSKYAGDHGGHYPQVKPNETVGVFFAGLVERGYVDPDELAVFLVCPASQAGNDLRAGKIVIKIPSREVVRAMAPDEKQLAFAKSSPSYGYRLPQLIGGEYRDAFEVQAGRRTFNPVFGDISGDPIEAASPKHRGSVIQIIGQNGAVISFTPSALPALAGDADLFRNKLDVVAAGLGPDDIVLGTSEAMPGLEFAIHER